MDSRLVDDQAFCSLSRKSSKSISKNREFTQTSHTDVIPKCKLVKFITFKTMVSVVMLWQILLIVTHSIEFRAFQELHYPLFLKVVSNPRVLPKLRFKSAFPTSNDILSEHWIGLISSL